MRYKKVFIVDISGRVPEYDEGLCDGLSKTATNMDIIFVAPYDKKFKFMIPSIKLLKIVPNGLSQGRLRRVIKFFEIIMNYFYLLILVMRNKPNVVQMEWLPLIEKFEGEFIFLKVIKSILPNCKILLKIHNIFPHECITYEDRNIYIKRYQKVSKIVDAFIVHTQSSKREVSSCFEIEMSKIHVIHHGVFAPNGIEIEKKEFGALGKWNLLMYGIQSKYKGADILLKALAKIPNELKDKLNVKIVGLMSDDYYHELCAIQTGVNVQIKPSFIEFPDLYKMINESDIIILPYRNISQSGVLLLALHFNRCLITSDLDSFKETLDGFEDRWFFHSEDSSSLANLISDYLTDKINILKQIDIIKNLNNKYSWKEAGRLNVELVNNL